MIEKETGQRESAIYLSFQESNFVRLYDAFVDNLQNSRAGLGLWPLLPGVPWKSLWPDSDTKYRRGVSEQPRQTIHYSSSILKLLSRQ